MLRSISSSQKHSSTVRHRKPVFTMSSQERLAKTPTQIRKA